jgi:hypothetical protein
LEAQLSQGKLEKGGRKVGIAGFVFGGGDDATKDEEGGKRRKW